MKRQLVVFSLLAATTFAALAALAGPTPALAAIVYEKESNSTRDTAQILPSITSPTTHTVYGYSGNSSDRDFYRVYINSTHQLSLLLTSTAPAGTSTSLVLSHDRNRNGVLDDDELTDYFVARLNDSESRTYQGMNSGFYFLEVFSSTPVSYSLRVGGDTAKQSQGEVEPNSAPEQANLVQGFVDGYRYLHGALTSSLDRDHYRFSLAASRLVNIQLIPETSAVTMHLYHDKNQDGQIDAATEFVSARSVKGGTLGTVSRALSGGTYILKLSTGSTKYYLTLGAH